VRISLTTDGKYIFNPTTIEEDEAKLNLVVA
jgi:polyribonucleotide nucleotidyltransferase